MKTSAIVAFDIVVLLVSSLVCMQLRHQPRRGGSSIRLRCDSLSTLALYQARALAYTSEVNCGSETSHDPRKKQPRKFGFTAWVSAS